MVHAPCLILQFFQAVAPQKGSKYDVRPEVMSNYVRGCAGYCVLTCRYVLGVGDRDLDNILIAETGFWIYVWTRSETAPPCLSVDAGGKLMITSRCSF